METLPPGLQIHRTRGPLNSLAPADTVDPDPLTTKMAPTLAGLPL